MMTAQVAPYRVLFDATSVHYAIWKWLLPCTLFAAWGVAMTAFRNLYGPERRRVTRHFGVLLTVVAIAMAVGIWRTIAAQRSRVVSALRSGRYELVEGVVDGFRSGAASGHPPEEFTVSGHHYQYGPAEQLFGFNRVAALGGPIRNGLHVRIADVGGLIARLEVSP